MPDGLPPEVVEARLVSAFRNGDFDAIMRILCDDGYFPAGVYVSDGQGNVTYRKELAEKPHGFGSGHDTTVTYDGQVQAFRYKAEEK